MMTDNQASRIERLLKYQALQLSNINVRLGALLLLQAGDDPGFDKMEKDRVEQEKRALIAFLKALGKEAADEKHPDDPELQAAIDRLKN